MDPLGGNGNGLAWYSAYNADITSHPLYQKWEALTVAECAAALTDLKTDIANSQASAQGAPILNYLNWVYTLVLTQA
jgi:hypothetical protein